MPGPAVLDKSMAKRQDISVKIAPEAAREAKKAAALKEMTLAEYLSEVVAVAAARDLAKFGIKGKARPGREDKE